MLHRTVLLAALVAALPAFAQTAAAPADVKREVVGNRTSENTRQGLRPSALAASTWPLPTALKPPRTISPM